MNANTRKFINLGQQCMERVSVVADKLGKYDPCQVSSHFYSLMINEIFYFELITHVLYTPKKKTLQ